MAEPEHLPGCLSLDFVEDLYANFLANPESVSPEWREYFRSVQAQSGNGYGSQLGPSFTPPRLFDAGPALRPSGALRAGSPPPTAQSVREVAGISDEAVRQDRVDQLVRAYRVRGHMVAQLDPLGLPRAPQPELEPEFYDLYEGDLDRKFSARTIAGAEVLTLRQILTRLRETYCQSIGVQYMHIDDLGVKNWIQDRLENPSFRVRLSRDKQLRILTKLTDAVIFEEFVQKKFLGAKSFSLEGSESLIPLLAFAIERASDYGVDEIVLGMAHRGRLNVLANIMGKGAREIFREFEDSDPELYIGSGDVKYHLGYSSNFATASGRNVHLSLCFNPSHLEFVNPVALGRTRAKQDLGADVERRRKLTLLIHGDAAFAGEGIIQETLNLSELGAYRIGGAIHVVVNNQIGFTTPPEQGRSSTYATDVAKMLQIPIFHVNGEDPEAVARVIIFAMDFRETFQRDVVIDMYGYRRHGHNEGDEPAFTQPLMYAAIGARSSVRDGYLAHLLRLGGVTREEADQIAVERRASLDRELTEARRKDFVRLPDWLGGHWQGYHGGAEAEVPEVDTAVCADRLRDLQLRLTELPPGFHPHKKVERLLQVRREMATGERPLDWGAAEHLAFASLVTDGMRVRMTGQDSERGTFSQRHAVLHDVEQGRAYVPLQNLSTNQAACEIANSPLSEAAVVGFEYGYSLDTPNGLILWEAQFGDFVNAAQVIIDQFLVSAEDKWKRLSGLVLLLPHGFEGMGPEHSSARMERFLMLAAEENIQLAQPTTPAQYFHLLRRQVLRRWRKPLIVFTPKSLLRHPLATSSIDECARGCFRRVIGDVELDSQELSAARRVLLCTGKIYYTLEQRRKELGLRDVAILRIEQLYPLPDAYLVSALEPFESGTAVVWVQDEPENMGAWRHLRARFGPQLLSRFPFSCISRSESASPATGSANSHRIEQDEILMRAFDGSE